MNAIGLPRLGTRTFGARNGSSRSYHARGPVRAAMAALPACARPAPTALTTTRAATAASAATGGVTAIGSVLTEYPTGASYGIAAVTPAASVRLGGRCQRKCPERAEADGQCGG